MTLALRHWHLMDVAGASHSAAQFRKCTWSSRVAGPSSSLSAEGRGVGCRYSSQSSSSSGRRDYCRGGNQARNANSLPIFNCWSFRLYGSLLSGTRLHNYCQPRHQCWQSLAIFTFCGVDESLSLSLHSCKTIECSLSIQAKVSQ